MSGRLGCSVLLNLILLAPPALAEEGATPVERLKLLPGFRAELLYSVPKDEQGSWVSMTVDPKGRLITSDQYGKLYRITPPASGSGETTQIETIPIELGMAHGLLYAFDSLYVMVNGSLRGRKARDDGQPQYRSGLYRVRDTNADDVFDQVELLREIDGNGEHGPHAVVLAPDGKSLFVCAGNHTDLPEFEESRTPRNWDEDILLDRQWDARGHARGRMAPGGWIARVSPDGQTWELFSSGYRNEYDLAFHPDGELFTYDSDMEWDIGTPWYRPTRVCHVTSGSEFGWRSGTGKWPEYYPDSLGSVVDIGPGSPTGIVFGTGARFPEKYQQALYLADWSYGIIYAVHLQPEGASYVGTTERFVSAQPLPVTDMLVHPRDGALYFTIGGRRTQSGLYRVSYIGNEPTSPARPVPYSAADAHRATRFMLEQMHGTVHPAVVEAAWPYLGHADRHVRFAARIAIEHQPVDTWAQRALAERDPVALIQAALALARSGHESDHLPLVAALQQLNWDELPIDRRLDLVRAYGLILIRLGPGTAESRESILRQINDKFPTRNSQLNRELAKLLIALEAPDIAARTLNQLAESGTQEDQIHYALVLKDLKTGWSRDQRQAYYQWFLDASSHRGGMSFEGFLKNIRDESVDTLTEEEKLDFQELLTAQPPPVDPLAELTARPLVQQWTVADLVPALDAELHHRNFEKGRQLFATAACYRCHRVRGEGGSVGPDLTGVGGRFNSRDLLESLIEPNKVISDQYQKTVFALSDGRVVEGRVINLNEDKLMVLTDMFNPAALESIPTRDIEESQPASTSMMPAGLLDRFTRDEVLDLVAFLRSGGDPGHAAFTQ
jgi:hypothetical protein